MDFHATNKPEGSAATLVRMVKAFSAAGISNLVVAVFDHDTAAADALRSVRQRDLPVNIAGRHYPALEWARTYPTIIAEGEGPRLTDINGVACSIEMYVGQDLLTDQDGSPLPVQLTGFDHGAGRHHGVVTSKTTIQRKFLRKAEAAAATEGPPPAEQWADLGRVS